MVDAVPPQPDSDDTAPDEVPEVGVRAEEAAEPDTAPEDAADAAGPSQAEGEAEVAEEAAAEAAGEAEAAAEPADEAEGGAEAGAAEEPAVEEEAAAEAEGEAEEPPVEEEPVVATDSRGVPTAVEAPPSEPELAGEWFVLKVQSNREDSIREAILRNVKIAACEEYLHEIIVPKERITEIKQGKKREKERKTYPGYIVMRVDMNADLRMAIRETPGVGDFIGSHGEPVPMSPEDVRRILPSEKVDEEVEAPKLDIRYKVADRVKIKEGTFENFEGDVEAIDEAKGLVKVAVQIFGRSTPVELEYWQVEPVE